MARFVRLLRRLLYLFVGLVLLAVEVARYWAAN